jgi:hypothetical protein
MILRCGYFRFHRGQINVRMLMLVTAIAILVGIPAFKLVKGQINHGVENVGDHFDVNLKSLGNFQFDDKAGTLENVPALYRKLDGKRVVLEGFVAPPTSADRAINEFQFVYNIQTCCFGGPPLVQERVFARVPNNQTIEYTGEEIRIIGVLHVSADKDEVGKIEKVYTMDVERAEPL